MRIETRVLLAVLLGLVMTTAAAAKREQVPSQLASTHGYVYVNFPRRDLGSFTAVAVGSGDREMLDVREGDATLAQGRWLPPGQYRLREWEADEGIEAPTFTVEAGRVTDLGSLIKINIGGYLQVLVPLRPAEQAHDIDAVIDAYAPYLASREPLRWEPAGLPKPVQINTPPTGLGLIGDLLEAYRSQKNKPSILAQLEAATTGEELLRLTREVTPPMFEEPGIDAAGNLYFGADFGRIRIRRPDGTWESTGIDTIRPIAAVEVAGDALIAGSDNGIVRRSTDGGATWTELRRFARDEAVVDIDYEDGRFVVNTARLVPLFGTDNLAVYVGERDDLSDLTKSRDFPLKRQQRIGWTGPTGQLVQGAYYLNTHLTLAQLDLPSMQWTDVEPPTKISSHRVHPATGDVTIVWGRGVASKVLISQDRGATWREMNWPQSVPYDAQLDAADQGFAIGWNPSTFASGNWEILSLAANGWTKVAEAPPLCKPIRVSPAFPVICITSSASILRQEGDTWAVEFSAE